MTPRSPWHYIPPPGPVLSILLVGMVLLSGVLYYRAVKIQRFLEPALALSQPRQEFTDTITRTFEKEFGTKPVPGLKIKASSILIEKAFLYSAGHGMDARSGRDLHKLARFFLALMKNEHMRSDISLVLIIGRFPYRDLKENVIQRNDAEKMADFIQDALLQAEPELGSHYASYFGAMAQPTNAQANLDLLEIRIVPSEFLHVEVLEKLEKYSY